MTIESLEARRLLSAGLGLGASDDACSRALADLPVAAQHAILSLIGREQSAYNAASGAAGLAWANPADGSSAQVHSEAELTAADGAANDELGTSISTSGDTVVVGAESATVGGDICRGAVYVFTGSGSAWTQTAKLTAADGEANDFFGASVAISGDTVVVGAVGASSGQGAAYVFTGSGSAWTQTAELTAADGAAGDSFGASVAISGNTLVVGAVGANYSQGAAYVFTGSGSAWTQTTELAAATGVAGDSFGTALATSGATVVVGADGVEQRTGGGLRVHRLRLRLDPDRPAHRGRRRGGRPARHSVAISGSTLVAGADGADNYQGSAYVFAQSGSAWTQTAESHRGRWRGGRLFRRLGCHQRQHAGGRSGRRRQLPGVGLRVRSVGLCLDPDRRASPRPTARRTTSSAPRLRPAATR